MKEGLVLYGINNIFRVQTEDKVYLARIKGKILKGQEHVYNALAPGDIVQIEEDAYSRDEALIISMRDRKNAFYRFNEKGKCLQAIAANLDLVICVSSPSSPPFRPRFIDRAQVLSDLGGVPFSILLNKSELEIDEDVEERLSDFERLGIEVMRSSAKTGAGIEDLRKRIKGKTVAFCGQSGVGKSTVLNALNPLFAQRTADVSLKFERGCHTTNYAVLLQLDKDDPTSRVIDTPGVRRLALRGIEPQRLAYYLPEFKEIATQCSYKEKCTHFDEVGCKVLEAVEAGLIHEDRYESYIRMRDEIETSFEYEKKSGKPAHVSKRKPLDHDDE